MNLVDSMVRMLTPAAVMGASWLREELKERRVTVPLTEAYVRELVADAVAAARQRAASSRVREPYARYLREEIVRRAEFLQQWTLTDDRPDANDFSRGLIRLAQRHALPRPWRLSVPVAVESRNPTPTYLKWASAS